MGEEEKSRETTLTEIDAALKQGWDKLTFVPTSISFQRGRPVSFAPIVGHASPATMIEQMARVLWETSFLRTAFGAPGIQDRTWRDLLVIARSDAEAKAWLDRTRRQALDVLTAMREPTEAMIRAAGSGPADRSCWQRIIDAALEEG